MDNRTNANPSNGVMSRIENDTEALKSIKIRIENIADRIIKHARSLGYYEPPPSAGQAGIAPMIGTLADAIRDLDRAVDHASGALNVFD